jgi:hypothetical protein
MFIAPILNSKKSASKSELQSGIKWLPDYTIHLLVNQNQICKLGPLYHKINLVGKNYKTIKGSETTFTTIFFCHS